MSGFEAPWWHGSYVDHLYESCPLRRRSQPTAEQGWGTVDPLGPHICGWCVRIWKARNPAAAVAERSEA